MFSQDLLQKLGLPDLEDMGQYIKALSAPTLISVGMVAAATTYYMATRPTALPPVCDLAMQSVELPGGEFVRRSVLQRGDKPVTHVYEDARTVYEFFLRGARRSNNGPFLGSRKPNQPYEWISYGESIERTQNLGSAFLHLGHSKTADPHIGVFAQNRPEWTLTELACYTYSLVSVPLYDTLGSEAIHYILDKGCISTVVCDVEEKVHTVLDGANGKQLSVKTIVLMGTPSAELVDRCQKAGVDIFSLQAMEEIGKAHRQPPSPPRPDDLAVICFTSGTTGRPKGAMLTHGNIVSNTSAFIRLTESFTQLGPEDVMLSFLPLAHMFERVVEGHCPIGPSDVHISFLPLAHMFERVVQALMIVNGSRIGFFQGDIRLLMDDLATLKPTVFPLVPRLLNRMYDKVFGQANTPMKRWLLSFAYRQKEGEMQRGIVRRNSIWDQLIFRKVQASVGGRVRLMLTGAAPISPTVLSFLRAAFGCQFYEGYGQTECTAACTMTVPGDWAAGHVGPPLPCNSVKLVDVEEMNYLAVNGEGEVCVKGANVFQGYLKDPERTSEAIDADGWLHTGDIGKWLPNGCLKIVDRKKHIFKLAQGEYIAPEKIENIYLRSESVAQIFVHGDSLQAFLVAVVVPDQDFLSSWTKKTLGLEGSFNDLCINPEVKAAILTDILQLGKAAGLKSFEQVKAIYIHKEPFSVNNGLLTPTLKAKRNEMRLFFKPQIEELYAEMSK